MWKRAVQCVFASVFFGYLLFLYLVQNRYHWGKEPRPDHFVDNGAIDSVLAVKDPCRHPPQGMSGMNGLDLDK